MRLIMKKIADDHHITTTQQHTQQKQGKKVKNSMTFLEFFLLATLLQDYVQFLMNTFLLQQIDCSRLDLNYYFYFSTSLHKCPHRGGVRSVEKLVYLYI